MSINLNFKAMKKTFTLFLVLFSVFTMYGQQEMILNGDFSQGVSGSEKIHDIAFWCMDMETPGSGWWSQKVGLTSTDTTFYQVVETISADSVLYQLTFDAANTWVTAKVLVIISVTGVDSTVRTRILTKEFTFDEEFLLKFGFSAGNSYAGQRLVVEFDLIPESEVASWMDLDNVSLLKFLPGVNAKPTAVVGQDQSVRGGDVVTLDGSGSSDPEGSDLTFHWVSVYPGITLSDPASASPTFTAPDVDMLSKFQFTLFVSDGELNSDTVTSTVTVIPAGELIRNGGFEEFVEGSDPESTSLKDIAFWNIDSVNVSGGRWGNPGAKRATLASIDPPLYQVVDVIGELESTYSLAFSARSSWNSIGLKSIFSIAEDDSTIRTEIDSKDALFEIDPPNGVNVTDMADYTHVLVIPSNSEYIGKKLVLEFDNMPYDDGTDDGWAELDNVSLVVEEAGPSSTPHQVLNPLVVYPNPARDRLFINNESMVTRADVYSVHGELLKSVTGSDIESIPVSDLMSGFHFIRLTTAEGVFTRKIQIK